MTQLSDQIPALHAALTKMQGFQDISLDSLIPMPTSGLAHDHVILSGRDLLLRVPRQSQMRLDAERNLRYQAACFQRMKASGHTPKFHGYLSPSKTVPMGALIVEHIHGTVLSAPNDLPAAAEALAAIHTLPLPERTERPPLIDQTDPMAETLTEVQGQAAFLPQAELDADSLRMIREELRAAEQDIASLPKAPVTLISFDAHPGNFLVKDDGTAILVDLEKGRYGGAGFDLAHATLYTSTTWDVATYSEPSRDEIAHFYDCWRASLPTALGDVLSPYLMPMRRLMWLWSITWCAKWRVESAKQIRAAKHQVQDTEDWSAENTSARLIDHVRGRVDLYLSPEIIERVRQDWS
ncbi:aminoglycoside phosphotransferase family protein [Hwanghaeella sp. LZ110]|uniref:aminoglycoside phosphotransferase family protein n=1 Tax=Hwanghaeella sp. LZ110 TaxID=3402810 RepID=UPI003B670208